MKIKLIVIVCAVLSAMFVVSCDNKDEVDCGALEKKFNSLESAAEDVSDNEPNIDVTDGLDDAECTLFAEWISDILTATKDAIATLKQGKSCSFAKDLLVDYGYESDEFDQLISDTESDLQDLEDELAGLCN